MCTNGNRIRKSIGLSCLGRDAGTLSHLSQPHFIIDVNLVHRGYSIPSPVLLKCCVASIVAQSIQDLYRPAWCVGLCLAMSRPIVIGFFSFRGSLVCNTVGSAFWVWSLFRSVAGQLLSFSTLMLLVGSFDL